VVLEGVTRDIVAVEFVGDASRLVFDLRLVGIRRRRIVASLRKNLITGPRTSGTRSDSSGHGQSLARVPMADQDISLTQSS